MKDEVKFFLQVHTLILLLLPFSLQANETNFRPDWLAVSSPAELRKTWASSLVQLPEIFESRRGLFLQNREAFNAMIQRRINGGKLPLILFLHDCEGLGHHRDDIENFSKLGFVVIAPDSFARKHRPLGCYEEQSRYIKYYDIAIAFRKAELDYSVREISKLPWVDTSKMYLIGSGTGGMVAAHYQGNEFTGHVIEGWGCRHPNKVFDGIWAPVQVRIFAVVSRNDLWYKDVDGYRADCARFLTGRRNSESIVLDRPAHYVSWSSGSRPALIKFLTYGMDIDLSELIDDTPSIVKFSEKGITLKKRWSLEAVYESAKQYCSEIGKKHHLTGNEQQGIYRFVCE